MVFTGEYEHTIDAKNRVSIPAEIRTQIRAELPDDRSLRFYVTLGESRSLCLYSEQGFQDRAEELRNSEADPDLLLEFESLWFSLARCVELDSVGRIRLPETLLKRTGLGSAVMLLGMNDHLEIRDRDTWHAFVDQMLDKQHVMNPRRVRHAGRAAT